MKPMKLDIQMFATPLPVRLNINFKDITEDELPESLTFSFDGEQAIIQITGISEEYFWTSSNGGNTFDSITIETEGYSITVLQVGNGTGTIYIDVYKNFSFVKKILEDNTVNTTTPDFSRIATTDEGMFSAPDNDGTSYYFRGAVTNNYVKFANFWWRIIRVNGNGSVRLIYDGTTTHANGESSTDRHIGTSAFNTNNNDNAYVGYMYGTPGSTTYEATHANVNNSAVKTTLDNWYESNLSNYSNYIDTEVGFWGDRTAYSGTGLGTKYTTYGSLVRLDNNKTPTFEYNNSNDLYTTSGSSQGNKALQYPIGLITADEVAYAGGVHLRNNTRYYLYAGQDYYWTMSPYYYSGIAYVYSVYSTGALATGSNVDWAVLGVRPVINLRGDLSVTGTGTSTDPYEVSLPVVPTITIFNGTELTNIYYNGTEISKMYCNGVLVFEKGPTVYKRRIMVGDNLKGKNIYSVFPKGHWSNMEVSYGTYNYIISLENSDYGIYETLIFGPMDDIYRVASFGISDEYLYDYDVDSGIEDQKDSSFDSNSDYIVSSAVQANSSYRCLYIEDPNIRPIQVGDKIINGTKLYFVVPDNFFDTENGYFVIFSNGDFSIEFSSVGGTVYTVSQTFDFFGEDGRGNFYNESICIIESDEISTVNTIGYYDLMTEEITPDDGRFSKYILVDTTTLG